MSVQLCQTRVKFGLRAALQSSDDLRHHIGLKDIFRQGSIRNFYFYHASLKGLSTTTKRLYTISHNPLMHRQHLKLVDARWPDPPHVCDQLLKPHFVKQPAAVQLPNWLLAVVAVSVCLLVSVGRASWNSSQIPKWDFFFVLQIIVCHHESRPKLSLNFI